MLSYLYHLLVYDPLLNLLVVLYQWVSFHDLGVAIILLTIVIRLLMFPLFARSQKHQMVAQTIQPHLKRIQKEHANDPQKQTEAMLALYKEHNFNPFAGFLLLFVQLPVLIALYHIFTALFTPEAFSSLYSFITRPQILNEVAFGLINLKEHSIVIVAITALLQYLQGFLMQRHLRSAGNEQAAMANTTLMFVGPLLTLTIFARLPAAVTLYWLVSTVFNIAQQEILYRKTTQK